MSNNMQKVAVYANIGSGGQKNYEESITYIFNNLREKNISFCDKNGNELNFNLAHKIALDAFRSDDVAKTFSILNNKLISIIIDSSTGDLQVILSVESSLQKAEPKIDIALYVDLLLVACKGFALFDVSAEVQDF